MSVFLFLYIFLYIFLQNHYYIYNYNVKRNTKSKQRRKKDMFKEILERQGFSFLFAGADYKATEEWLIENNCLRL